jgi:hypothetical protein
LITSAIKRNTMKLDKYKINIRPHSLSACSDLPHLFTHVPMFRAALYIFPLVSAYQHINTMNTKY